MAGSYLERNDESRARLQALVELLSDDDLRRPIEDGWTVYALLAHIAFWDRLRVVERHLMQQGGSITTHLDNDIEHFLVNDAALSVMLTIPPREAARLAVQTAEEVDRDIANVPTEWAESFLSSGGPPWILDRSRHRIMHLDTIEEAIRGA